MKKNDIIKQLAASMGVDVSERKKQEISRYNSETGTLYCNKQWTNETKNNL